MSDQATFTPIPGDSLSGAVGALGGGENAAPSDGTSLWEKIIPGITNMGYNAANTMTMGALDKILKLASPGLEQNVQSQLEQTPLASAAGNIAGVPLSLLTGTGELQLASKLPLIGKIAKLGLDTSEVGPLAGALRGAIQSAPLAATGLATGYTTPQQAQEGLELGGLFGLGGSLLGKGISSLSPKLSKISQDADLNALGVGKGILSKNANYGTSSRQQLTRALAADNIRADISSLSKQFGWGGNINKFAEWDRNTVQPVFNAVDATWQKSGTPIAELFQYAKAHPMEAPDLDMALRNPIANKVFQSALEGTNTGGDIVPMSALREMDRLLHTQANAAQFGENASQAPQLRNAANAFSDLRNIAEQKAAQAAESSGAIPQGSLDWMKQHYPAIHTLRGAYENAEKKVFSIAPGSSTMNKLALGALVGGGTGGLANPNASPQDRLKDELMGAAAGMLGGEALNRGMSSLATRGLGALAEGAAGGGGIGGIRSAIAGGLGGLGGPAAVAAKGSTIAAPLVSLLSGGKGATPPNPMQTPIFTEAPTWEQLSQSDSPLAKTIARKIFMDYGTKYFSMLEPGTNHPWTIDDLTKAAWKGSNGFTPADTWKVLADTQGEQSGLQNDLKIADMIHSMDWPAILKWYGRLGEGELGPLRGVANTLNIGKAPVAEQQLQSLLLSTQLSPAMQDQVRRIMRNPNQTPQQAEREVINTLLSTKGVFSNPGLLQTLGIL